MMRSLLFAGPLLLSMPAPITWAATGHAGESWKADALRPLDVTVGETGVDGARVVTVTINRAELLQDVPMLQEHDALSRSVTGEEVAKRPASYSNVLSLLLTSYAVRDLYAAHPDLAATRWKVLLAPVPGGGVQGPREMFSFAFDRPRYETTAWDRLAFTEFPHAVAGFSYNLRFTLEMSREADGSIADD